MFTTRDIIEANLRTAEHFARIEILTAMQQPARRLITVLKNRSAALHEEQVLEEQISELVAYEYEEIDL